MQIGQQNFDDALYELEEVSKLVFSNEDNFFNDHLVCRICSQVFIDPWACSVCKITSCYQCLLKFILSRQWDENSNCLVRCTQNKFNGAPQYFTKANYILSHIIKTCTFRCNQCQKDFKGSVQLRQHQCKSQDDIQQQDLFQLQIGLNNKEQIIEQIGIDLTSIDQSAVLTNIKLDSFKEKVSENQMFSMNLKKPRYLKDLNPEGLNGEILNANEEYNDENYYGEYYNDYYDYGQDDQIQNGQQEEQQSDDQNKYEDIIKGNADQIEQCRQFDIELQSNQDKNLISKISQVLRVTPQHQDKYLIQDG
ncbi:UNKNOWN [Stylonychia lemnae]|uniref:C2H2-type domain-containing protein n=1 Tax=Stylonychia lemnae TaxID=5949 RepID=A0A078AAV2_STYLE|nr:UNKNOWN [Stylonychia lemnae]|eukprot:CDW79339.1 UNKNOWN [Stylonychia lemnae]